MNWIVAYWIPHPDSLGILWSLAVEEQFYLLWPFAIYWLSERGIAALSCGLIVLAPVLRWIFTPILGSPWPIYALTPFRMDLLAMGALLAIVWRHHREKIERFGDSV
jgi:peptidoglycan/LPS O-acetylase OafA/YrhL